MADHIKLQPIASFLSQVVYNAFFHPLSKYPGPFFHKISRIPYFYKHINGTLPFDMLDLHRKYGDIVRIAPDELAFSHPDAWKDIMGHQKSGKELGKAMWFYQPVEAMPKHIVNEPREEHARIRRQLAHGFSEKGMREQEPIIKHYLDLFIRQLRSLSERGENPGLDMGKLVANAEILIIGGSETTATLLSGATYYILRHPDVLNKLVEEVRTTFQSEDDINLVSVGQLTYMLAVLNEALRMYPPIANGLPRQVPQEGTRILDQFIPGNTYVAIHQWALYRREEYFLHADEFHPERFLDDQRFAQDRKDTLQPFHVGPRNCLGRK
ncbi:hypothetical protein DV737_g386, partial [Chaetothyriales sp. CBS 132003]